MQLMHKDLQYFIDKGAEKNAAIDSLFTFIFFGVVPFNLLKYAIVSLVISLVYKYISKLIKQA